MAISETPAIHTRPLSSRSPDPLRTSESEANFAPPVFF